MTNPHALPNFIHFGTPKSGSGTISYLLTRHPQVFTPRPKELNFFNRTSHYQKGLQWYKETYFSKCAGEPVICDKSIGYSAGNPRETMQRIVDALGADIRILLTVRSPVERAYSNYCMARYKGQFERLSFEDAIRSALSAEGGYTEKEFEEILEQQSYYSRKESMAIFRNAMYLSAGRYAELLELCRSAAGNKNVLVLFTEDMKEDLPREMRRLTDFLGIEPLAVDAGFRRNEATALRFPWLRKILNEVYSLPLVRNVYGKLTPDARRHVRKRLLSWNYRPNLQVPPLEPKARTLLLQYYRKDIAELQALTGRDLSHWVSATSHPDAP